MKSYEKFMKDMTYKGLIRSLVPGVGVLSSLLLSSGGSGGSTSRVPHWILYEYYLTLPYLLRYLLLITYLLLYYLPYLLITDFTTLQSTKRQST